MSNTIAFAERYFPYIFKGTIVTIELTVVSLLISIVLGLIAAIAKLSGHRIASAIANVYIELIRATPALLQLFIIYFGLTSYGVSLDSFTAAVLTLGFIGGAYLAEVFRAGIQSVDRGQVEAAVSLGMVPSAVMRRIILPQALVLTLPPFTNFVIALIKDTSLALTIAVPEIMYRSYDVASQTFRSMEVYVMAGVIYLAVCLPLSGLVRALDRRQAPR
jgi:His/Glu/Gln/Arg/opine family amino acid ABC transporter permease subunit